LIPSPWRVVTTTNLFHPPPKKRTAPSNKRVPLRENPSPTLTPQTSRSSFFVLPFSFRCPGNENQPPNANLTSYPRFPLKENKTTFSGSTPPFSVGKHRVSFGLTPHKNFFSFFSFLGCPFLNTPVPSSETSFYSGNPISTGFSLPQKPGLVSVFYSTFHSPPPPGTSNLEGNLVISYRKAGRFWFWIFPSSSGERSGFATLSHSPLNFPSPPRTFSHNLPLPPAGSSALSLFLGSGFSPETPNKPGGSAPPILLETFFFPWSTYSQPFSVGWVWCPQPSRRLPCPSCWSGLVLKSFLFFVFSSPLPVALFFYFFPPQRYPFYVAVPPCVGSLSFFRDPFFSPNGLCGHLLFNFSPLFFVRLHLVFRRVFFPTQEPIPPPPCNNPSFQNVYRFFLWSVLSLVPKHKTKKNTQPLLLSSEKPQTLFSPPPVFPSPPF